MIKTGIAVVAAAAVLGGAGPAFAEAARLPDGFLLMEATEHKTGEQWATSDKRTTPLLLDPCHHGYWTGRKATDAGRYASRTIMRTIDAEMSAEQVAVYRDERAAQAVMNRLRADLRRCADRGEGMAHVTYDSRPLKVGDEGIRVGARYFEGGLRQVAVRRGAAILIYTESAYPDRRLPIKEFAPLVKQARTMAAKVCWLPEAACQSV